MAARAYMLPRIATMLLLGARCSALGRTGRMGSGGPNCKKRIHLNWLGYAGLDKYWDVQRFPELGNGCWNVGAPVQEQWRICWYDKGPRGNATGGPMVYDDTNPAHDAATEQARVDDCIKNHHNWAAHILMAPRPSWKRVHPTYLQDGEVVRYHAELYTSESTQIDLLDTWLGDKAVGDPIINVGHWGASQNAAAADTICGHVGNNAFLSFYASTKIEEDTVRAVYDAVNRCTGK